MNKILAIFLCLVLLLTSIVVAENNETDDSSGDTVCTEDSDCGDNEGCDNGVCVEDINQTEDQNSEETDVGDASETDDQNSEETDVGDASETDDQNSEETDVGDESECATDSECAENEVCTNGECEHAQNESLDDEAQDYENEQTGDEELDDLNEDLSDDNPQQELAAEDKADIESIKDTIGVRQYVLNVQLKARTHVAIVQGRVIIKYLEEKGYDATSLNSILDDLTTLDDGIDPRTMTNEEFNSTVQEVRDKVKEFKDEVHTLIGEDELPGLRKRIQAYDLKQEQKLKLILDKEERVRKYANEENLKQKMEKVQEEAQDRRQKGDKLLDVADRIKEMQSLKQKYENGELNATQLKARWAEEERLYGLDRARAIVQNARAKLAIDAIQIRAAIRKAKADGEDTTDLENKLQQINQEIETMRNGQSDAEQIDAKVATIRTRIRNLEEDGKIRTRLRNESDITLSSRESRRAQLAGEEE